MANLAKDLKQQFEWATDVCLEAYVVLADGRSFERSERDESAIDVFKALTDTVGAIPKSLITEAEELLCVAPEIFDKALERQIRSVGPNYAPASAAEFLETLNQVAKLGAQAANHAN